MLSQRLVCEISIRDIHQYDGRPRYEATIASEDGQTIYIYEGQLKEVAIKPQLGRSYLASFRPFVNNRWVELKLHNLEEISRKHNP